MSPIEALAARQLDAYNAADLDAFCGCYHADVVVLAADGTESFRGLSTFRQRYRGKFEAGGFGATVETRLAVGEHCVDLEHYWVDGPPRSEGTVLVRYSLRDERIGVVQFFR
jgi:hypothetical protein